MKAATDDSGWAALCLRLHRSSAADTAAGLPDLRTLDWTHGDSDMAANAAAFVRNDWNSCKGIVLVLLGAKCAGRRPACVRVDGWRAVYIGPMGIRLAFMLILQTSSLASPAHGLDSCVMSEGLGTASAFASVDVYKHPATCLGSGQVSSTVTKRICRGSTRRCHMGRRCGWLKDITTDLDAPQLHNTASKPSVASRIVKRWPVSLLLLER